MTCKKCNSAPGTIVLRKKDAYCEQCFMINTNHKFRSCIGKNKILSRNEHVLVCASGGKASTVLLDLIKSGLGQDIHKKLRILPKVLHIIESADKRDEDFIEMVNNQCKAYNMDLYFIHITEYLNSNPALAQPFSVPDQNVEEALKFHQLIETLQPTTLNDFITKIKRNLFMKVAELLDCSYIFTAETTTRLAVNLLSNLAIGRGSQVENDIGFCDSRTKSIKLLRPMKDISNEELDFYMKIKQIAVHPVQSSFHGKSIQSLIQSFVTDLQVNFQATISTVCKTAEKIGGVQEKEKASNNCSICQSEFNLHNQNLTALQATKFSQKVSHENPQDSSNINLSEHILLSASTEPNFPFKNKSLCYSCSKISLEMNCPSIN